MSVLFCIVASLRNSVLLLTSRLCLLHRLASLVTVVMVTYVAASVLLTRLR